MATTPRGYPIYTIDDPTNGPAQMEALARAIDTDVGVATGPVAKLITRLSGSSTFANNTDTTVAGWDTTPYDKGGIAYNAGVFTVPVGGLYAWSMTLTTPTTTPAYLVALRVQVNGTLNQSGQVQYNVPGPSSAQSISAGGPLTLAANDTVTLRFQQVSGAAMAVTQVSASLILVGR